MKTIILFFFLTVQYFAQVQGCTWTATLADTGEVDYYYCGSATEFWRFTIALTDSSDTVKVYAGTNLKDSTITEEVYTTVSMVDQGTGDDVDNGLITGDEATHTYFIKWGYKLKNIKIESTAWTDTTTYYIEAY